MTDYKPAKPGTKHLMIRNFPETLALKLRLRAISEGKTFRQLLIELLTETIAE